MSLLVRSQLRFVTRAPWSAATALLGVALGVASVVAVHLISARVVESLDAAEPPHLAGVTHVLQRPGMTADDYFDLRARWRRDPHSAVEAMVPVVEGTTRWGRRRLRVLGADWLAMPSPAAAGGVQRPAVSDDVLVGEALVADASLGVAVGDTMSIGGRDFRVSAVQRTGLGAAVVADIAAAQVMLGAGPDAVNRIGLRVHDPWQPWRRRLDRLMPGFGAGLPAPTSSDLSILGFAASPAGTVAGPRPPANTDWRLIPVTAERPSAQFARAVLFDLGALGTLALLVAWFLIYQVGVIWLRRQHLLMERLHAVGVSGQALRRSFVTVFLVMGSLATAVGIVAGALLASALTGLATRGVDVALPRPPGFASLDGWVIAKAVISGLGVCLLGGLGAFAREWRPDRPAPRWLLLGRRSLAPLLVAAVAVGLGVERTGVLGGFLAIFAMSLAGVALVAPLLALLRRAVVGLRGSVLTRLALRGVAWYPQMLGVALAALSLAVATSIGIALMVESFRGDFDRMLAVRLAGDLYVDVTAAPADTVSEWLAAQPAVGRVTWTGDGQARVNGVPVELGYGRFDARESARYGYSRPLAAGEALVSERLARDLHLAPGARVEADHGTLTVVGTFPGFGDPTGRMLVDAASLDRLGVTARPDRLTVTLAAGAKPADLRDRLSERFPSVTVESRAEIRATALDVFDRTFAITQALTLLALVVAVVGTYNALTALRLHQAPTNALLRAEGVTAAELRRIALLRAGLVGGLAMALAAPLGLAMAWTLCAVINPRSFGWTVTLHFPLTGWLPPLVLGVLAAVLAGALPAPRERGSLHEAA